MFHVQYEPTPPDRMITTTKGLMPEAPLHQRVIVEKLPDKVVIATEFRETPEGEIIHRSVQVHVLEGLPLGAVTDKMG